MFLELWKNVTSSIFKFTYLVTEGKYITLFILILKRSICNFAIKLQQVQNLVCKHTVGFGQQRIVLNREISVFGGQICVSSHNILHLPFQLMYLSLKESWVVQ